MRVLLVLSVLLFSLTSSLAARPPLARFELASVPRFAQAVSRLGNGIAPRFQDTVAGMTLALTLGAARYGMDLTRPLEISFYAFGEQPVIRIAACARTGIQNPESAGRLWGIRFHAERKGDRIILDTEGLSEPFPAGPPPGSRLKPGELLRGTIQTEALHREMRFGAFTAKDDTGQLFLNGLDELLEELTRIELLFSADETLLRMEFTAVPRAESGLAEWLKRPLPPKGKIETFSGADMISVFRLNPTGALRRYGQRALTPGKKHPLVPHLLESATGFATLSVRNSGSLSSVRLFTEIRPEKNAAARQEVMKLDYTPFSNWYLLRREPFLFCSASSGGVVFCRASRLDRENLKNLFRPIEYQGVIPDCPLVCLDPKRPERPLAEMRVGKNSMQLILQAPDSWFAARTPLLSQPLPLPEKSGKRTGNPKAAER